MKKLGNALLTLLGILGVILELLEFLLLPALFLLFGLWQQMPWQYYAITIGGYFALFLICELVLRLIFNAFEKKYASRFTQKVDKIISKFSKNAENPPAKDN